MEESVMFQMSKIKKDIVQRKTVIIADSLSSKNLPIFFNLNNLMESEHKYNQQFIYSYVSKSIPNYRQIYRM